MAELVDTVRAGYKALRATEQGSVIPTYLVPSQQWR
jgi:hypothetical protein